MNSIQITEQVIRALMKSVGPVEFATALNNAMVHGTVLEERGLSFDDKQLGEFYEGVDALRESSKNIEESNGF